MPHAPERFTIGDQCMPPELSSALAWVKWGAAWANRDLCRLEPDKAQAIVQAAERVATGEFGAAMPLSLWQGGVAASSNLDMNELLARLASLPPRGAWQVARLVDPMTEVNLGQQTGLVFAAAMQVAVALQAKARLLPALTALRVTLAAATAGNVRLGCDAALAQCEGNLRHALVAVHAIAFGVDESLAPEQPFEFGERLCSRLAERLDLPLAHSVRPLAGHQTLLPLHGTLRALAIVLARVGDHLPSATTACPGGVQAMAMVCAQVVGHDAAIGFAAGQAQRGLDVFEPLILMDTLDSMRLLADAINACIWPLDAGASVAVGGVIGWLPPAAVEKLDRMHGLDLPVSRHEESH